MGGALVDIYAKCGDVSISHKLFKRMSKQDVGSWNEIIIGYSHIGNPHGTLTFFNELQVMGIKTNSIIMVSVLHAFADLLTLE